MDDNIENGTQLGILSYFLQSKFRHKSNTIICLKPPA